jgi:hypothetical protein
MTLWRTDPLPSIFRNALTTTGGQEVAHPCSCCDHPATHHFTVSYRGQVLRGDVCEEHANAVARERLGLQDHRWNLTATKIGRALTDPNTNPRFQRIAEPEYEELAGNIGQSSSALSLANGFSARRRRSTSPSRRSGYPVGKAKRDDFDHDLVLIRGC